jgi:hypothetical protein
MNKELKIGQHVVGQIQLDGPALVGNRLAPGLSKKSRMAYRHSGVQPGSLWPGRSWAGPPTQGTVRPERTRGMPGASGACAT